MTTMCPPQHGHSGRTSGGSTGASWWRVARPRVAGGRGRDGPFGCAGEQAVVADAVEPLRQDVEQEAADELVGGDRHRLLPVGAGATIILVAERDAALVEAEEAAVRDRDPVGVAGQIGEHRLRPGEGRLGVDDPALLPDRCEVTQERTPVGEVREAAVEREPARSRAAPSAGSGTVGGTACRAP